MTDYPINYLNEALQLVPITEYSFLNAEMLDKCLNHGFDDLDEFFPSWKELLDRSQGKVLGYDNYMAYLLCSRKRDEIIGFLAVNLTQYEELLSRVKSLTPEISTYLYLSWIALDYRYRKVNYFAFLFEYYHALIRRFQKQVGKRIGGAAIAIRRMRPMLWSLLNTDIECPLERDKPIYIKTTRITYLIEPCELFDPKIKPPQDHVLILFDSTKNRNKNQINK